MARVEGPNGKAVLTTDEGVAELRLVDPDRRNCVSADLVEDLHELVLELADWDDLGAVLLTADGPVYSAGLDTELLAAGPERVREVAAGLYDIFEWLRNVPVAVVSAARGPAVGAGASWFCYVADLKVASPAVEIWWPEIEYGRVTQIRSVFLTAELGPSRATELLLLGHAGALTASEAEYYGLVNRVVDDDSVEPTARDLAETIARTDAEHGVNAAYLEAIYRARDERVAASEGWANWQANKLPYSDPTADR